MNTFVASSLNTGEYSFVVLNSWKPTSLPPDIKHVDFNMTAGSEPVLCLTLEAQIYSYALAFIVGFI